jgi:phage host-nuclease inhibitor protein Gam
MTNHVEQLDYELAEITQPLVDHLHRVEQEIEQMKRQIADLTVARRRLTAIVRNINPELAPVAKQNGTAKPGVSQAKLDELAAYLNENRDELNGNGGFTAGDLFDTGRVNHVIKARSGVSIALRVLHDHGVLRLDHVGTNNAKHFKVV